MMNVLNLHPPPSPPRLVAFTTPENYAARLSHHIHLKGWKPLHIPTISVQTTPETITSLQHHLLTLHHFSAIAFTSRTGITAFSEALSHNPTPPLPSQGDETFTVGALGNDSELLNESFLDKLCKNPWRIRVLVPPVATPSGLVDALGVGGGRRILCPVPVVVGIEEPPVVPDFLHALGRKGWVAVRADAYETRRCCGGVKELVGLMEEEKCGVDAVVFTSTGEVEGLLKGLEEMGMDWGTVRRVWPRMIVAAHGPVTAAGAERLGVGVDVVSSRFDSFEGVVDALSYRWDSQLQVGFSASG